MKFIVRNDELRAALLAVRAHASTDQKDLRSRSIDLTINARGHLLVTASNGNTSGIARVQLMQDEWAGELGSLTIDRDHAAQIAGYFTGDPMTELEVTITGTETPGEQKDDKPVMVNTVKVRQLGQLFGGDQLKFSTPQQDRDVATLWHEVASALRRKHQPVPITRLDARRIGLFRAASAAYDEPLQLSVADSSGDLVVQVGDDFIGHLHAWVPSKDEHVGSVRTNWVQELPLKLEAAS